MKSNAINLGKIEIPRHDGEDQMIVFDMKTLEGIPDGYRGLAEAMLAKIKQRDGFAYFTIHGRSLKKTETLRRPAPHTDGNYEPVMMSFGGQGGFKVGETGPRLHSPLHDRQYNAVNGGLLLASTYPACVGWVGEYDGLPGVGGDCRHLTLGQPFILEAGMIYYGNNHFIHESMPVDQDTHRTFVRITLPEDHVFDGQCLEISR